MGDDDRGNGWQGGRRQEEAVQTSRYTRYTRYTLLNHAMPYNTIQ